VATGLAPASVRGFQYCLVGAALWSAVLLHAGLAAWCVVSLLEPS
jgi:hypothetical protein